MDYHPITFKHNKNYKYLNLRVISMKKTNTITLAIAASLISSPLFASTAIDIRHEWKTDKGDEATRIKLGEKYKINDDWGGNVSIEMKFRSQDKSDTYKNNHLTETELDWGFTYKLDDNWKFEPGMPIAMTSNRTEYKPQMRVVYNTTDMMGAWTALRYRHIFVNHIDGHGELDMDSGSLQSSTTKSRITSTGGLQFESLPKLKLSYEANYTKSHDNVALYNNKDWKYDYGVIAGWQMGNWRPYAEVWNVDTSPYTDDRQARLRIGLNYKF